MTWMSLLPPNRLLSCCKNLQRNSSYRHWVHGSKLSTLFGDVLSLQTRAKVLPLQCVRVQRAACTLNDVCVFLR